MKLRFFLTILTALIILHFESCKKDDKTDYSGQILTLSDMAVRRATVNLTDSAVTRIFSTTYSDTNGKFNMYDLDNGKYRLTFKRTGFTDTSYFIQIGTATQNVFHIRGGSSLKGNLIDGKTGLGMQKARLYFYNLAKLSASPADTASEYIIDPDANGYFSNSDVPVGVFFCTIRAKGYMVKSIKYLDMQENDTTELNNIVISEGVGMDTIRFLLSWNHPNVNLDAHLTGPLSGSPELFHCWAGNKNPQGSFATMLLSDEDGIGPEIIEITGLLNGTYHLWVHNQTDTTSTGSSTIGTLARIEVYNFEGLIQTITAPEATTGNAWEVFEMKVTGKNFSITAKNHYFMYYP